MVYTELLTMSPSALFKESQRYSHSSQNIQASLGLFARLFVSLYGIISKTLDTLFRSQLQKWPMAHENHEALNKVWCRELASPKFPLPLRVQCNPARLVSTGAKIDKVSISARPCFLCETNRPEEQQSLALNEEFEWLVNPFPILPNHYTIAAKQHRPQRFLDAYDAMIQATKALSEEYIVFYNGPKCGASAPDHLHLQAGISKGLPLVEFAKSLTPKAPLEAIAPFGYLVYLFHDAEESSTFNQLYESLPITEEEYEPRMNVVAYRKGDKMTFIVIPRHAHRPLCYSKEGDAKCLISPGALDMCGLLITPRLEDYERLTATRAANILCEVGVRTEPTIDVGIMQGKEIAFSLNTPYFVNNSIYNKGEYIARLVEEKILFNNKLYDELSFVYSTEDISTFSLHNVTIGKEFHWQQQETQTFQGALILRIIEGELHAINRIAIEDYLTSVIASEMSGTSSVELLKAHAVISRSWLLAQIRGDEILKTKDENSVNKDSSQFIKWYDREAHTHFDVCADDHCQRYQGVSRKVTPQVYEAIRATRGVVLSYEGEVCDARFSKCCGGKTELYESCWDDTPHPYLSVVNDPFCNTNDPKILSEVLNHYDQSTDFYRWTAQYTQAELSELVHRRGGFDYGDIIDLIPIERGPSGRIVRLQIVGTKATRIIGKELEIRRTLSETHLYSSAFEVEKTEKGNFILHGSGWGHGVGLCQIGAAVMGAKGYNYKEILHHYYPESTLTEWYTHSPQFLPKMTVST